MPSDMTMEWPHPRVCRIDLYNHIPQRLQQLYIPALRVRRIDDCAAVPLS